MTIFHFVFDLNHFAFIREDFYRDPLWTVQRTCILSLFLLCAGFGQAYAVHAGQSWDALLAARCKSLVSSSRQSGIGADAPQ